MQSRTRLVYPVEFKASAGGLFLISAGGIVNGAIAALTLTRLMTNLLYTTCDAVKNSTGLTSRVLNEPWGVFVVEEPARSADVLISDF